MIAELGHFALLVALWVSLLLGTLPIWGWHTNDQQLLRLAPKAAILIAFLVGFAYLALTVSFIFLDFSIAYVTNNANSQLPLIYRISGVWGAHEGSMLLWNLVLSGWCGVFAWQSKHIPLAQRGLILALLGLVQCGFLLFSIATSNPFSRIFPVPLDGLDLNPLLQDPGLAIHPPTLYVGYVGFAIPFAFAVAALICGKIDTQWAIWLSPWVKTAWAFLTLGIALGSWWAYNELGWGGWWFWDPVENASFMPWLIGTALAHSLAANAKRGVFTAWTILLSITAFALSLIGAFLVRSGILTSVHAFATDAGRGVFILVLLTLVVGISLSLYALRAHLLVSSRTIHFFSRETALLLNNLFLVVITLTILIGTLYPLVYEAFGLGKLSVGPPYFDKVVSPLAIGLFVALGLMSHLHWGENTLASHRKTLIGGGAIAVIMATGLPALSVVGYDWRIIVGSALAGWIATGGILILVTTLKRNQWRINATFVPLLSMTIGHLGVAFFVIGVSFTSANSMEFVRALAPGDTTTIERYQITYRGTTNKQIENYETTIGTFHISRNGRDLGILEAEKRFYPVQQSTMTEAAIRIQPTHDLFIALGERLQDDTWSVRIQYKSFIRSIWFGALLITFAALCSLIRPQQRQALSEKHQPIITQQV